MEEIKEKSSGVILCAGIAVVAWIIGGMFPIIGGAVTAIIIGMILSPAIRERECFTKGIAYTSKKILQYAVILLGFGLNLSTILATGRQSLPIIIVTIAVSLIIAFLMFKIFKMPSNTATLVGVGSSICGGSAIAATAPVIGADDEEIAQAISVVFFFNVLAALIFPQMGVLLGFSEMNGEAFGIFAGTAVNDTSSVTATASSWDTMFGLGNETLDKAVTVKLTRTLAIIPITLVLAFYKLRMAKKETEKTLTVASRTNSEITANTTGQVSMKKIFPFFILYFIGASVITTLLTTQFDVSMSVFAPFKTLSKFFIVMAMAAIGLNTNIVKLVKTGGKPLLLGFVCWVGIIISSLLMQHVMGLW